MDIREVLEDGALHRQLVQVGVEEGDDALWVGRRAVEVHCRGGWSKSGRKRTEELN